MILFNENFCYLKNVKMDDPRKQKLFISSNLNNNLFHFVYDHSSDLKRIRSEQLSSQVHEVEIVPDAC